MGSNLWIGRPGAMREISQRADLERSPTVGAAEHRSLEGQVTTWSPKYTPRRHKLSWKWLQEGDARHLDRLARRLPVGGPYNTDPVVLIDPAAGNLFDPHQAEPSYLTQEGVAKAWEVVGGGSVIWYFSTLISGGVAGTTVWWRNTQHPSRAWPTTAGMTLTFVVDPPGAGLTNLPAWTAGLQWTDIDRNTISTVYATGQRRAVTGTAPAAAAFVRPFLSLNAAGTGYVGRSCLAVGTVADTSATGDGAPAYAVTGFTETVTRLPYRDVTIELVEVAGAS